MSLQKAGFTVNDETKEWDKRRTSGRPTWMANGIGTVENHAMVHFDSPLNRNELGEKT